MGCMVGQRGGAGGIVVVGDVGGANKESVSEGKKTSSKNGSKKLRAYGTDGFIMKLETIVDRVESIEIPYTMEYHLLLAQNG